MENKVIIVESPGKIKTIEKFLGASYKVVSSNGHIRDLPKSAFGIDIADDFKPTYELSPNKKKEIVRLKKSTADAQVVYLASDGDREGEAIAWHTKEVLGLSEEKYERVVFHSITKAAIEKAMANPRRLNDAVVNAQQARRLLDRMVGYKLSPLLWRKVQANLSAGRVQSVAVRLIVEQERAIRAFIPQGQFKVKAIFVLPGGEDLVAELPDSFATYEEAYRFLEDCQQAAFTITAQRQKTVKRVPLPPFMTSTLQQAAAQALSFSIDQTMRCAQKLYESGKITYMRTDSLNLSQEALEGAKKQVLKAFGKDYHKTRYYQSKAATAQEAHEAIRPTHFEKVKGSVQAQEQRLYTLIRNRALASQMSNALIDKTTVTIAISTRSETMIAKGEVIQFKGFLAAYQLEEAQGGIVIPPLTINQSLSPRTIQAREAYTRAPARYAEATLVKKLEVLGIGRPSTYRPIIATIQQRGYIERATREKKKPAHRLITLEGDKLSEQTVAETTTHEKNKLFPTSIGVVVTDFLMQHFQNIMDYGFTANTESKLDQIAQNQLDWKKMLATFYAPFSKQIVAMGEIQEDTPNLLVRLLGEDPKSGKPVFARLSRRSGPMVQLGEKNETESARFASLREGQLLDQITLGEALKLFDLPREVGSFEEAPITAHSGPFGPYLKHNGAFFSLGKRYDPYIIKEEEAKEVIRLHRILSIPIKTFAEDATIQIRNGRFGPYIKLPNKNVKIPKDTAPETLTLEACKVLIEEARKKGPRRKRKRTSKK